MFSVKSVVVVALQTNISDYIYTKYHQMHDYFAIKNICCFIKINKCKKTHDIHFCDE